MLQISEILKKVFFFETLEKDESDFIVERLSLHSFGADEQICKIGDPGDKMYIIVSGKVKVVIDPESSPDGTTEALKEKVDVAHLGAGDYFGEMSLFTGEPRSASVITTESSKMYILSKTDFTVIVERFPSVTLSMSKVMSQRLRATLQKALSATSADRVPRERRKEGARSQGRGARGRRVTTTQNLASADTSEIASLQAGFSDRIVHLIGHDDLDAFLERHPAEVQVLTQVAAALAERAFSERDPSALYEAHKTLYELYEDQVRPVGTSAHNQFNPLLLTIRNSLEKRWEHYEIARIAADASQSQVPADPEAFGRYFTELCADGSLADHRLFEFLENHATRADLIAFFLSDAAVIVRFCDLVVLTMVGADDEIRGELAENLWDEMGQGRVRERHIHLFRDLLEYAGINPPEGPLSVGDFVDNLEWPGLAGYNFYLFLCLHHRNQLRSLGALGAAESMDSAQYSRVLAGCRRVGFDETAYYAGHESMDFEHGDHWLEYVLLPLVRKYPEKRHEIVLGARMRINVTRDYYDGLAARFSQDKKVKDRV